MDEFIELLMERINEAIAISGNQKKLCKLSGVSEVTLSRLKSYHKGVNNYPQKRENLSIRTLMKLADAIGEDVAFFIDRDYVRKKQRKKIIYSNDIKLMKILEKLNEVWGEASQDEKGFITIKLGQLFDELDDIKVKREAGAKNKSQTA